MKNGARSQSVLPEKSPQRGAQGRASGHRGSCRQAAKRTGRKVHGHGAGLTVLLRLASLLSDPPLTIGGPGFDSQLYLKIITPLHSLSGPQFLYLPQNRVKPRGLRETTGAKTPQSHHCGHPGGPEASQGPSPGQPAGRAAQSSSKHKTSAGPRFP